ncbi:MAG: addiction module protein [Verrucomicrobiota bacterium]|nr:addiction module protein [Verrucomicrobiota bacterium]
MIAIARSPSKLPDVTTLGEIESAVEQLPASEQEQLLVRLAAKLAAGDRHTFPVRDAHLQLLEERFAAFRDDPRQASMREDVKRRFEASRR